MRNIISLGDTVINVITKMSQGNPGAIRVLVTINKDGDSIDPEYFLGGLGIILMLDSLGIYGSRIWMLFKDVCSENIVKTVAVIRACQIGILTEEDLNNAIDGVKPIDVDEIYHKVRLRLIHFDT